MAWTATDLTNVENAIRARLTGGEVESYSIGGRDISKTSLADLYTIRDQIAREVQAATTGPPFKYVVPGRSR